jgi:hypothetical protein
MSMASKAKLAALIYNTQDACSLQTTLEEMGHPQPSTAIQTDNKCANGIANNAVKQQGSRAMDMRLYWIRNRIKQLKFLVHWKPGLSN